MRPVLPMAQLPAPTDTPAPPAPFLPAAACAAAEEGVLELEYSCMCEKLVEIGVGEAAAVAECGGEADDDGLEKSMDPLNCGS